MKPLFLKYLLFLFVVGNLCNSSLAQVTEHELNGGIKVQKAFGLYWENGFTADYTNNHLWQKRVHLGFSYCTSRLGTAYHSNAIKQDNYLLFAALNFRNQKLFEPIIKLNTGFFYSDMEDEIFDVLPHKSPLLSLEAGVAIKPKYPVKLMASFGYNFITGNGISGPGTLYPFYYQISLLYVLHL